MEKEALSSLKYVVILALLIISSFQILCTKGRQIKSVDKQEAIVPNKKDSLNEMPLSPPIKASTSGMGFHDSAMANKADSQPTQTGSSPGIGHHFLEDSTDEEVDIPKSLGATSGLEHSVTPSTKDYRPTQTGSSPGIGHHLVEDSANQEVDPKSLGATSGLEHSVTASTKDFQPTVPGHSRGAGHASEHKN